jgi:hypothetical protein
MPMKTRREWTISATKEHFKYSNKYHMMVDPASRATAIVLSRHNSTSAAT